MKKETKPKTKEIEQEEDNELKDFSLDIKRGMVDIVNDCPSIVRLGEKEYAIKNMRYYSLYRIAKLVTTMHKNDEKLDDDNKILTALCTDLDAMCEIVAVILCNHYFTSDGNELESFNDVMTRNDKMVDMMKAKVMNNTFDVNQWAAIVLGAVGSMDLTGFFLLKKSVSMVTDSLLTRRKKSAEIASQFMEALSLQTQATS